MIDLTTYREILQAIRRHRDDSGILHAVALLDAEVGRLMHESARMANAQRLEIEALKARVAELDPPWTLIGAEHKDEAEALWAAFNALDDSTELPFDVTVRSGVDVAFADGDTACNMELRLDDRGWYSCNDEGLPAGWFDEGRAVVTHFREHIRPRHPTVPRETNPRQAHGSD